MCRSGKCFQSLLTLVIVLASVSICEAGVFGRCASDITMRKFSAVRCGTGCSGPGSAGDIRDCVHGQQTCERGGWRENTQPRGTDFREGRPMRRGLEHNAARAHGISASFRRIPTDATPLKRRRKRMRSACNRRSAGWLEVFRGGDSGESVNDFAESLIDAVFYRLHAEKRRNSGEKSWSPSHS